MKNNFEFTLSDFPNDNFEFENILFSSKATLKQNGIAVERSTEKGKPFLIKNNNGEIVKGFIKMNFPDFSAPVLSINGQKNHMTFKLKWYEYLIGGFPLILILGGGIIMGLIVGGAVYSNYSFFRSNDPTSTKYLKVIGVNVVCLIVFGILFALSYKLRSSY